MPNYNGSSKSSEKNYSTKNKTHRILKGVSILNEKKT